VPITKIISTSTSTPTTSTTTTNVIGTTMNKTPCLLDKMATAAKITPLWLPDKYDTGNALNATNKTFNDIVDLFTTKKLGFPAGEHSSIRKSFAEMKRTGRGYKFVLAISEACSYISQHTDLLKTRAIQPPKWLMDVSHVKTSAKVPLNSGKLGDHVRALRSVAGPAWAAKSAWKPYVKDTGTFADNLEIYPSTSTKLRRTCVHRERLRPRLMALMTARFS
jgi:hypothetical protein